MKKSIFKVNDEIRYKITLKRRGCSIANLTSTRRE
jgi:hypothetical protein